MGSPPCPYSGLREEKKDHEKQEIQSSIRFICIDDQRAGVGSLCSSYPETSTCHIHRHLHYITLPHNGARPTHRCLHPLTYHRAIYQRQPKNTGLLAHPGLAQLHS